MSNSPSSDAEANTVTVAKKPQPIPWTHEETVNLIRAYQEKWYSLKRGPLKASQWEEVAVTIAVRCRTSPYAAVFSKTGTQCRHKIEKLRKRYRAEKARPNPSAAWPYFDLMEQMERGPLPISVALPVATLNRQQEFDDEDDYEDGDDRDDEDYGLELVKRRKFEPRVSSNRRLDKLNHNGDGFRRNGKKLGGLAYGEQNLRPFSNPISNNSRFQKRKFPYGEEYQDYEDEENITGDGKKESRDVMGELAVQMKEFSERFMRMERKKVEAMRETQRYRMEMENKRMQMILVAQQKTVEMISRAFANSDAPSSSPSSSSPPDRKFQMG